MRRLVALTAMATVVVLAACSYVDRPTHVYRPSGIAAQASPASGEQLFLRDCAWCHGADGRGHEDDPSIVTEAGGPADVDFVLSTGRMPLRGEDQRMVRGTPAYTRKEIDAIVDYVRTLQPEGPEIPIVDLTIADRGRGEELYQENCAACHASSGVGGALTSGLVAPSLNESSTTEIAEAIRVGPGTMPRFGSDSLDDSQMNDVVAYVDYLQDSADPGGFSLGRVGPVTEGLVGWVLGLGLLIVVIRWIGTKADE